MDIPTKKPSPRRGREPRCKNLSLRRILRDGRGKWGGKNLLKIFHAKIQISKKKSNKTNNKIVDRYRITQNENMEGLESKLNLCLNLPLGQNKSLKKIFLNITVISKAILIYSIFSDKGRLFNIVTAFRKVESNEEG